MAKKEQLNADANVMETVLSVKADNDTEATNCKRLSIIGKQILDRIPSMDVIYISSDAHSFGSHKDALLHAQELGNKTVIKITR